MKLKIVCTLLLLLASCQPSTTSKIPYQYLNSRDNSLPPLYRAKVPDHWMAIPVSDNYIDTTKPIAQWEIKENDQTILVTVHNFPGEEQKKVPLLSQVDRWKHQFSSLEEDCVDIQRQAFSGFYGYSICAQGVCKGIDQCTLGWALRLGQNHTHNLLYSVNYPTYLQLTADVTIKAVGPKNLVHNYKSEIEQFAKSFELIDPIQQDL
ncbi:hypothetical protein BN1013_02323 [Candidatus Rubidus massiliensis]|nr:hypothetical protein BN1013_02323 [Candidatus Rubidus massiliensis]